MYAYFRDLLGSLRCRWRDQKKFYGRGLDLGSLELVASLVIAYRV